MIVYIEQRKTKNDFATRQKLLNSPFLSMRLQHPDRISKSAECKNECKIMIEIIKLNHFLVKEKPCIIKYKL